MSIQRLFDAVERRGDIGRRVAALVLPISNRARMTSSCAGKFGLREPSEHTSGPNLVSRDNVAHNRNLYTILETPPRLTRFIESRPVSGGRPFRQPTVSALSPKADIGLTPPPALGECRHRGLTRLHVAVRRDALLTG